MPSSFHLIVAKIDNLTIVFPSNDFQVVPNFIYQAMVQVLQSNMALHPTRDICVNMLPATYCS